MLDKLIQFILAFCLAVVFVSCSMIYTMFYCLKLLFK